MNQSCMNETYGTINELDETSSPKRMVKQYMSRTNYKGKWGTAFNSDLTKPEALPAIQTYIHSMDTKFKTLKVATRLKNNIS